MWTSVPGFSGIFVSRTKCSLWAVRVSVIKIKPAPSSSARRPAYILTCSQTDVWMRFNSYSYMTLMVKKKHDLKGRFWLRFGSGGNYTSITGVTQHPTCGVRCGTHRGWTLRTDTGGCWTNSPSLKVSVSDLLLLLRLFLLLLLLPPSFLFSLLLRYFLNFLSQSVHNWQAVCLCVTGLTRPPCACVCVCVCVCEETEWECVCVW